MKVNKYYLMIGLLIAALSLLTIRIVLSAVGHAIEPINNEYSQPMGDGWSYSLNSPNGEYNPVNVQGKIYAANSNDRVYLRNTLPGEEITGATLMFRSSHQYVMVWIDGENVYSYGYNSISRFSKAPGSSWNFIRMPKDYMGKEIIIELISPYQDYAKLVNPIYIGSKSSHLLRLLSSYGISTVSGILLISAGAISLMVYLLLMRLKFEYLSIMHLSYFAILIGIWITCESRLIQLYYNNPYLIHIVSMLSFYMIPIPFILFVKRTYAPEKAWVLDAALFACFIFNLASISLQLAGIADFMEAMLYYHGLLLLIIAGIIYVIVSEVRKGNKYMAVLLLGIIVLAFGAVTDMIIYYIDLGVNPSTCTQICLILFIIAMCTSLGMYLTDYTYSKASAEALQQLAYTDMLTGIGNRTAFEEEFEKIGSDTAAKQSSAIIMFDMNGLKDINDSLGHRTGDEALIECSDIIKTSFSGYGLPYRIGGDEFVVLIHRHDNVMTKNCLEKLFTMTVSRNSGDRSYKLELASGTAVFDPAADSSMNDVFIRADSEMYKNKIDMKKDE